MVKIMSSLVGLVLAFRWEVKKFDVYLQLQHAPRQYQYFGYSWSWGELTCIMAIKWLLLLTPAV